MNIAYNIDCIEYMHTLPDKAFDLAIVDPPYGLKASGAGITGGKKCIRALNTMPMEWEFRLRMNISKNYSEYQRIRLSAVEIISIFLLADVSLCGTSDSRGKTFLRANTCGHRSMRQRNYSVIYSDRNVSTQRRSQWRYTNISLRPLQSKATRFLTRI